MVEDMTVTMAVVVVEGTGESSVEAVPEVVTVEAGELLPTS